MSLWLFFQSDNTKHSPHRRACIIHNRNQRASFCICQRASYTLESAVVIPLLAGYLVTLLFFFSILEIQCKVDEALLYAGRKTAVESSVIRSEEVLLLSAEGHMIYALKEDSLIERFVKHGAFGIRLWKSEFDGEEIILRAEYVVQLPITFFGIHQVELSSQNSFVKWIGDANLDTEESFVYISKTGEVYHKSLSCRSINLSIHESTINEVDTLRGKAGQKYYACPRCEWEDINKERIFYTDYGSLYHKSVACSALRRTVSKIKLEEVGYRRPCSYCYGL